jgi:pyruvate dehydrogenase E1 component
MRRMLEQQADEFYYLTVTNEAVENPSLPRQAHEGVVRGIYLHRPGGDFAHRVQLFGSGAIMGEVLKAARQLSRARGCGRCMECHQLHRTCARGRRLRTAMAPWQGPADQSWLGLQLQRSVGPIIAATDYVRALPELVRAFLPAGRRYVTLGTDGFGRSDSRAALRRHFEVDAAAIVQASLRAVEEIVAEEMVSERGIWPT